MNSAKTGLLRTHHPVINGGHPKQSCYQEVLRQHDHRYPVAPEQLRSIIGFYQKRLSSLEKDLHASCTLETFNSRL